jgi:hypothetical protein
MHYGITIEATDFTDQMMSDWRDRLLKIIFFFVPRANPDNELLYPRVRSWALEIDEDGWPQREVGLDSTGKPLFVRQITAIQDSGRTWRRGNFM